MVFDCFWAFFFKRDECVTFIHLLPFIYFYLLIKKKKKKISSSLTVQFFSISLRYLHKITFTISFSSSPAAIRIKTHRNFLFFSLFYSMLSIFLQVCDHKFTLIKTNIMIYISSNTSFQELSPFFTGLINLQLQMKVSRGSEAFDNHFPCLLKLAVNLRNQSSHPR